MAIQIQCACGKRLRAPEELGGRKDYPGLALAVAIASFGWLMFQIESAWRLYGDSEEDVLAQARARPAG